MTAKGGRVLRCPNQACNRVASADGRHCPSPTCSWWRCEHCGYLADRQGRSMPGRPT